MTRSLWKWPAVALLVLATAACEHGPFNPYWDGGTYDLLYANDRPVPTVVFANSGDARVSRVEVTGGTLSLRRDDSYQLLVTAHESGSGGEADVTYAYAGRYDYDGRTLFLNYFDPDLAAYAEIDASWREESVELVLPGVAAGRGVLMRFVR